jgi:hypothetical protein
LTAPLRAPAKLRSFTAGPVRQMAFCGLHHGRRLQMVNETYTIPKPE